MSSVIWQEHLVSKKMRLIRKQSKPCVLWFTGLSGAGKSTIANAVELTLYNLGQSTYLLDGDNIRHGLCVNLGFSEADRTENIRRIGEVSRLFVDAGLIVLCAFISPFSADRKLVRQMLEPGEFIEIYVSTPLKVCEERDPKGLYVKARKGVIKHFTAVDSPYEPPESPEIIINTAETEVETNVLKVIRYLRYANILQR